ncbi:hypothetical protein [Actinophytocola sp.]|uniref:hypothetical protein n=1 Tax=Actinophytocola sp. TaxID=1872138 RepID=UPI002D800B61|nr:hypothetical protein [Actinophytocola sp.]HET9141809.1 hypothetical protein [Actinophytocola sp.]
MHHSTQMVSPGIEPIPLPDQTELIGGRADSWVVLLEPVRDDEQYEPTIVRGRE